MSRETTASWTNGWGLASRDGPWSATPRDKQILNSRSGGEHPGHGNWMQTFNPKPYIQTKPSSKQYKYNDGANIFVSENFETPLDLKIPGINKSGKRGTAGGRINGDYSKSPYGVKGSKNYNGASGWGLQEDKSTNTDPEVVVGKTKNTADGGTTMEEALFGEIKQYSPDTASLTSNVNAGIPNTQKSPQPLAYENPWDTYSPTSAGSMQKMKHQKFPTISIPNSSWNNVNFTATSGSTVSRPALEML